MDELFVKALEIKLLEKQKLEQIYLLTSGTQFVGEQEEIDIYAEYIDGRQSIIEDISRLDVEYKNVKELLDVSMPQYNQIVNVEQEIKIMIEKIKQIDDVHKTIFSKLKESLSKEMSKSLRSSNVSSKYLSTAENISSVFFDRKN
jgi:hypothetical protein